MDGRRPDDRHRQRMVVGAVTLAEAIHNVRDLLLRLADVLVPDFADLMVAAEFDSRSPSAAVVRPNGDEARQLVEWVVARYGGRLDRSLSPRLYTTGFGLSVIVVPVLEARDGGTRLALALGRRADAGSFDSDDIAFTELLMGEIASRVGLQRPATTAETAERAETAQSRARRLQRLTAQLSEAVSSTRVAEVTADHAMAALGASAAWVGVVEGENTHVQLACAPGLSIDLRHRLARSPLSGSSPLAAAVRLDEPQWLASEEEVLQAYPELSTVDGGVRSLTVLPLSVGERKLGAVGLCRERTGGFSADERGEVLAIGTLGAQALERARRFETAQQVAATLSLSLLPRVPDVPGITVYSRYLPAATEAQVGGDWYDVTQLNGGRVGLVVGDVAGQGVRAAAVMGQLRTGLRAYLREGHTPGAALELTDVLTTELSPMLMATVWCGVLDPASGHLTYANAGHLPPGTIDVAGGVTFLASGQSPPLGVRWNRPFVEAEAEIERGTFLVCYTDGLIERPGERLDEGLERLANTLRQRFNGLDDLGDHLLELPVETHVDDVALLAVYRDAVAEEETNVGR